MAALSPAESHLRRRAASLAILLTSGQLTLEQLAAVMRQEIGLALTAAFLAGTGGQRSPELDAALRTAIQREYTELDRLTRLLQQRPDMPAADVQRRLEAFADSLDEAQMEGERLTQQPVSPLIPLAIGGALGAFLERITRPAGRTMLPRIDSAGMQRLYTRFQSNMDSLSEALANGELLLDDWHERMRREVRNLHAAFYQAGRGGALTPEDQARLNEIIQRQWDFLGNWRNELTDAEGFTPEAIRNRARMYLYAGNASFQDAAVAALGLPPLPAMPGDGSTVCLTACKCSWQIMRLEGNGDFDCYWRLRPAEHCETCETRASLWSPIQVRGGVVQPFNRVGVFA